MKQHLLFSILLLAAAACGQEAAVPFGSAPTPIEGGEEHDIAQAPWMAQVYTRRLLLPGGGEGPGEGPMEPSTSFACGASILDARHLVTAAHCVDGQDADHVWIVTGAERRSAGLPSSGVVDRLRAQRIVVHPGYQPEQANELAENDVAIIETEQPMSLWAETVGAIAYADSSSTAPSTTVAAVGYGDIARGVSGVNPKLRYAEFVVIDQTVGLDAFAPHHPSRDELFFVRGSAAATLRSGDSGSSLFVYDASAPVLVGVHAAGCDNSSRTCNTSYTVGAAVRVHEVASFIEAETGVPPRADRDAVACPPSAVDVDHEGPWTLDIDHAVYCLTEDLDADNAGGQSFAIDGVDITFHLAGHTFDSDVPSGAAIVVQGAGAVVSNGTVRAEGAAIDVQAGGARLSALTLLSKDTASPPPLVQLVESGGHEILGNTLVGGGVATSRDLSASSRVEGNHFVVDGAGHWSSAPISVRYGWQFSENFVEVRSGDVAMSAGPGASVEASDFYGVPAGSTALVVVADPIPAWDLPPGWILPASSQAVLLAYNRFEGSGRTTGGFTGAAVRVVTDAATQAVDVDFVVNLVCTMGTAVELDVVSTVAGTFADNATYLVSLPFDGAPPSPGWSFSAMGSCDHPSWSAK